VYNLFERYKPFNVGFFSLLVISTIFLLIAFNFTNILIAKIENELFDIIINSIADAYLQVSVFVAAVLLLFYGAESIFGINLSKRLQNGGIFQVPAASALGALPGCGGALLVITQFTTGNISFGSVVAVLTSTMGDAAFLLIASEPKTGFFIMFLGFFVGLLSGWIVDYTHPKGFLVPKKHINIERDTSRSKSNNLFKFTWLVLLLPGLVIGLMMAFQIDVNELLQNKYIRETGTSIGFIAGSLLIIFHLISSKGKIYKKTSLDGGTPLERTFLDTNFVTVWVVIAFLLFELVIFYTSFDLKILFSNYLIFAPLIAVLIGFIPGCGPQIIITSTYLMGVIPLSAQIGNAISNDGDALFPILAIAPKVGLVATLYSAIPAIFFSYGFLLIFE